MKIPGTLEKVDFWGIEIYPNPLLNYFFEKRQKAHLKLRNSLKTFVDNHQSHIKSLNFRQNQNGLYVNFGSNVSGIIFQNKEDSEIDGLELASYRTSRSLDPSGNIVYRHQYFSLDFMDETAVTRQWYNDQTINPERPNFQREDLGPIHQSALSIRRSRILTEHIQIGSFTLDPETKQSGIEFLTKI